MNRSLALLVLPLLLAGCKSPSDPASIDSYRSSFFGQQPGASSQLAAMPEPGGRESGSKAASAGRSGKVSDASAADAAPYKPSLAAYIKRYAVDKNSLKLAKIGTPFQGSVNGQKGSVICVELGGLSANRTAYLLSDNKVVDSEFGAAACHDKHLEPWDKAGT